MNTRRMQFVILLIALIVSASGCAPSQIASSAGNAPAARPDPLTAALPWKAVSTTEPATTGAAEPTAEIDETTSSAPAVNSLETAGFTRRFDHFVPSPWTEGNRLIGLVQQDGGWQLETVAYPPGTDWVGTDYAHATDRLLVRAFGGSSGPGNLGSGKLTIIDVATQAKDELLPGDVVTAGWAPNGRDIAYIMATHDSYELRWLGANGEDKLLAADVPHSLRVSPDGRFVAFTRESRYGLTADPGLYVVEIKTGLETQLSTLDRAGYGAGGYYWKPIWSPDGSQLLLRADSDPDRAAKPHEAGFVWAAANGSFSHFLTEATLLAQFDGPLTDPDAFHCLTPPVLLAANRMVISIGECQPMVLGTPSYTVPVYYALDEDTGTVDLVNTLSPSQSTELLTWDIPGESLFLLEDGHVVSRPMLEADFGPDSAASQ